jgi:hypothetical protein
VARAVSPWIVGALGAFGSLAVFSGVGGCGPSFQAIYEGDSRFEHCYALEENPSVAMQQKGACWNEWLQHYTYGQTRDRVEYAAARSRALTAGHELPTDEAMMGAAPGEGRKGAIGTAPAPTSAFAPPPKTMADMDGSTTGASSPNATSAPSSWGAAPMPTTTPGASAEPKPGLPPPPLRPPLADCTDTCGTVWTSCKTDCEPKPGKDKADKAEKKKACEVCERTYKACIKACAR